MEDLKTETKKVQVESGNCVPERKEKLQNGWVSTAATQYMIIGRDNTPLNKYREMNK